MCIAIAKQEGMVLYKSILETCFENNPDGAGFCVEVDGELQIHKGYFTFEEFYKAFKPYEALKALIHFRIRTHGDLNADNCHPFSVNNDIAFIHNGIISNVHAPKSQSDTWVFKDQYLAPLVSNFGKESLEDPVIKPMIESFIGASKLAMMVKGQEDFVFFNESLGNRSKDGTWFSNHSWTKTVYPITSYKKQSRAFDDGDFYDRYKNHPPPKTAVTHFSTNGNIDFLVDMSVITTMQKTLGTITIPTGATGKIVRLYSDKTMDINFDKEGYVFGVGVWGVKKVEDSPLLELNTWDLDKGAI